MLYNIFYHFILGAVQGLTEFLPVSSSAHLVIFQNLFGFKEPQIMLDVVLHLGTLTAVVIFLWRNIANITVGFFKGLGTISAGKNPLSTNKDFTRALYIIIATVPTAIIGVLFKKKFEAMFGSLLIVGCFLIVTGFILFFTKKFARKEKRGMNFFDALIIGIMQGVAICPGISRSGITISTGIYRGLDPAAAAKFSFLLAIPAILGAAVVELKDFVAVPAQELWLIAIGFAASAVFGYIAIALLLKIVRDFKLYYFSYYCWAVGIAVVVLTLRF